MRKITFVLLLTSITSILLTPNPTRAEYNPSTGRFLQRDPIVYEDKMNLYECVESSPINYYDPYGYCKSKCQPGSIDFIDIKMQITRYNTEDQLLLEDDDEPSFTGDETKDKLIRKILEEILKKKKYKAAYDWALEKVADAVVASTYGYHVRLKAKYKCCIKEKTCIKLKKY